MQTKLVSPSLQLLRQGGGRISAGDALAGKRYLLIYFSAHWCPPCRAFTPQLKAFYEAHHANKQFEVLFVSLDQTEEEADNYFRSAHGAWLKMGQAEAKTMGQAWMSKFGLSSIPSLVVVELGAQSDTIVTTCGRMKVASDAGADTFPWTNADAESQAQQRKMNLMLGGFLLLLVLWYIFPR